MIDPLGRHYAGVFLIVTLKMRNFSSCVPFFFLPPPPQLAESYRGSNF